MEKIVSLRERQNSVSERQSALLGALEDAIEDARQTTDITMIEIIGLLRFLEASLLAGGIG